MKKIIHKADERGYADHGWLKTSHSFSFAGYHDPNKMRFGLLRVLNDDIVEPGMGFGTHPHDNMEIVSIPLKGALAHKDSTGNEHVINTGDVQIMSAGYGLTHSEFNASKDELVNFLQLWIFPKERDIEPRYEQKTFNTDTFNNEILTVVSPEKGNGTLWINQDAYISFANFEKDLTHKITLRNNSHGLYVFILEGKAEIVGEELGRRDAIGISETSETEIKAIENSRILLIEHGKNKNSWYIRKL
jgi:redox-sensitive bicupin YhaK (pirin superfamily)